MNKIAFLKVFLFIFSSVLITPNIWAVTWDEPFDEQALVEADAVIVGETLYSNPFGARFKVLEVVAQKGQDFQKDFEFPVAGYYAFDLNSITLGIDEGKGYYEFYKPKAIHILFLKKGEYKGNPKRIEGIVQPNEIVFQLPTPTASKMEIVNGIVKGAHLWISIFSSEIQKDDYISGLKSLWNITHNQPLNAELLTKSIERLNSLPVDSKEYIEVGEQAFWLNYLALVGDSTHTSAIVPYVNSPYYPVRLCAVRALGHIGDETSIRELVKAAFFPHMPQSYAIQALAKLKAYNELKSLEHLLVVLSDESPLLTNDIMDPRFNRLPSPKEALQKALKEIPSDSREK